MQNRHVGPALSRDRDSSTAVLRRVSSLLCCVQVSANCLAVLRETDGLPALATKRTVYKLLNRIKVRIAARLQTLDTVPASPLANVFLRGIADSVIHGASLHAQTFSEWSQCLVLELATFYEPQDACARKCRRFSAHLQTNDLPISSPQILSLPKCSRRYSPRVHVASGWHPYLVCVRKLKANPTNAHNKMQGRDVRHYEPPRGPPQAQQQRGRARVRAALPPHHAPARRRSPAGTTILRCDAPLALSFRLTFLSCLSTTRRCDHPEC